MKKDLTMVVRIPEERKHDFLLFTVLFGGKVVEVTPFPDGQETNNIIPDSPSRKDSKMED